MPKKRRIPLRQCLGCMERFPKRDLVRVVRTPEGAVMMDLTGKQNGRGAYVCAKASCLRAARGRLAQALETEIPSDVFEALAVTLKE